MVTTDKPLPATLSPDRHGDVVRRLPPCVFCGRSLAAPATVAEATLDPCTCGGRFRYDAPPRCPACRSTSEQWDADPTAGGMFYD